MIEARKHVGLAVSTHSRPKAAGHLPHLKQAVIFRFNSQPPEGGWNKPRCCHDSGQRFNSQPPEGGRQRRRKKKTEKKVSTHSRPKAAGVTQT